MVLSWRIYKLLYHRQKCHQSVPNWTNGSFPDLLGVRIRLQSIQSRLHCDLLNEMNSRRQPSQALPQSTTDSSYFDQRASRKACLAPVDCLYNWRLVWDFCTNCNVDLLQICLWKTSPILSSLTDQFWQTLCELRAEIGSASIWEQHYWNLLSHLAAYTNPVSTTDSEKTEVEVMMTNWQDYLHFLVSKMSPVTLCLTCRSYCLDFEMEWTVSFSKSVITHSRVPQKESCSAYLQSLCFFDSETPNF